MFKSHAPVPHNLVDKCQFEFIFIISTEPLTSLRLPGNLHGAEFKIKF
jgi:hypothetical protein